MGLNDDVTMSHKTMTSRANDVTNSELNYVTK